MAKSEEEKDYEAVDKRKVKVGKDEEMHAEPETETPEPETEAQAEEPKAEEQPAAEERAGLPPVDVDSLLKSFIGLLAAHAWQWLGLVKNPVTDQMERDLAQAKVAVDSISALIGQLEGKLDPSEQNDLQGLLSDLRINFVQQSAKESQSGQ